MWPSADRQRLIEYRALNVPKKAYGEPGVSFSDGG